MKFDQLRLDHRVIFEMIQPNSKVLDLGCGQGELLSLLTREKQAKGQGIEIDEKAIYSCVKNGLSVFHGDIDSGLSEYPDASFDYVILNQSLQQVTHFDRVFKDALRVGKKIIVGFPNFAYYQSRWQLFFLGKAPVTKSLPYSWYDSPNLHFFSILDFMDYCRRDKVTIERVVYLGPRRRVMFLPNFFATSGIFLITRGSPGITKHQIPLTK